MDQESELWGAVPGPALPVSAGPEAGSQFDIEQAARRLRHHTLVGFALSSVLPLLVLAYLVHAHVLPFMGSRDASAIWWIGGLVAASTVAATFGGLKILKHQAHEVRVLAARLNAANSALADANVRLQELSFRDPVTDLYNRRFFLMRLEEELSRYRRYKHPLTIALLDLDGFKAVNDEYGHAEGDQTLHEVARIIMENSRGINVVARWGGDEFVVLLVETGRLAGRAYCERIRRLLSEHVFPHKLPITASFGVAAIPDDDTLDSEKLLALADARLYAAKRGGKNRVAAISGA